jgi:di/tricarboxylate transporter
LIQSYGLRDRFRVFRIGSAAPLIGKLVAEARLRTHYGVALVAIIQQSGTSFKAQPALAETVMRCGDLIAVAANREDSNRLAAAEDLVEEPVGDQIRSASLQALGVAEVMLAPEAPLIGKTLREAEFRRRRGLTVLAIKHHGKLVQGNLIDTRLRFGDLILVVGAWPLIAQLKDDPQEFVVLRLPQWLHAVAPAQVKAPYALGILVAMTVIMTAGLLPNVIAVLLAALTMVAIGCVPAKGVYGSIGWSTLVLISGMLPLATALENTGVTAVMATGLTRSLADFGPYAMLGVLFVITAAVGLFVSNTATAVLMTPVAIGAAQALGASVHAFAVTVAIASSCAFVTPVSSPVNTLVLEPGRYAFTDFVKVGLPLLLLSMMVTVIMVGLLYPV